MITDAIQLAVISVCQGNFEREYSPVYMTEAPNGKKPGIEGTQPHLPDDVQVIPGYPARIKPEYNPAIGGFLPFSAHFLKDLVIFGPLGCECGHFYDNLACALRSGC